MESCDRGTSWYCSHSDNERGAQARSGHFIETEKQSKHPTQPHEMASSEPNSTVRKSYITLIFILAEKKICVTHNNP